MDDFKVTVKQWLKDIGRDREWLATQLNKPKRTIDNWLSPSYPGFPSKWYIRIKDLMDDQPSAPLPATKRTSPDTQILVLKFTEKEWSMIQRYRQKHPGVDIAAMAEQSIIEWAAGASKKDSKITDMPSPGKEGERKSYFRGIGPADIQNIS